MRKEERRPGREGGRERDQGAGGRVPREGPAQLALHRPADCKKETNLKIYGNCHVPSLKDYLLARSDDQKTHSSRPRKARGREARHLPPTTPTPTLLRRVFMGATWNHSLDFML